MLFGTKKCRHTTAEIMGGRSQMHRQNCRQSVRQHCLCMWSSSLLNCRIDSKFSTVKTSAEVADETVSGFGSSSVFQYLYSDLALFWSAAKVVTKIATKTAAKTAVSYTHLTLPTTPYV